MSKKRIDFAPYEVREAMKGKQHHHYLMRQICEKVIGKHYAVNRPGKTAYENWRKSKK